MEKSHNKRLFYVLCCVLWWLWQHLSFSLPTPSFVFQFPSFPALAPLWFLPWWIGWEAETKSGSWHGPGRQALRTNCSANLFGFFTCNLPAVLVLGPLSGRDRPVCCVGLLWRWGQMIIRGWLETLGYTGGQGWYLKVNALTARCHLLSSQPPARCGPGGQDATSGTDCCHLHFITHLQVGVRGENAARMWEFSCSCRVVPRFWFLLLAGEGCEVLGWVA